MRYFFVFVSFFEGLNFKIQLINNETRSKYYLYVLVTYAFQSESTLYSCLNDQELLARSRCKVWILSDCIWIRTHNHLVHKRTPNHLAKLAILAKWLIVRFWIKWLCVRVQLQSFKILYFDLKGESLYSWILLVNLVKLCFLQQCNFVILH